MLEFVRDGDTVYITKLDRLARNTLDLHNIDCAETPSPRATADND